MFVYYSSVRMIAVFIMTAVLLQLITRVLTTVMFIVTIMLQ